MNREQNFGRRGIVRTTLAQGWNGTATVAKDSPNTSLITRHNIVATFYGTPSAGGLVVRAVPHNFTHAVTIGIENVAVSTQVTAFVVRGYYSQWRAYFHPALFGATCDIIIASSGDSLASTQPRVEREIGRNRPLSKVLAVSNDNRYFETTEHASQSHHHVCLRRANLDAATVSILARPLGSKGFAYVRRNIPLVGGTLNEVIVGFYDAFAFESGSSLDGSAAVINSYGEELELAQV